MTRVHSGTIADPGDLLSRLPADTPWAWVRHGEGLIGWGEAHRVEVPRGTQRFAAVSAALEKWFDQCQITGNAQGPGTGPVAFASLTFDWDQPGSSVVIPRVVVGRRDGRAWMTVVDGDPSDLPASQPLPDPVRVRYAGTSTSEIAWLEAVAEAARDIRTTDDFDKVVLARDLQVWAAEDLDVRPVARRLAERFDGCWTFVANGLVGATPELLVRRTETTVESIVLAGSAARGRDLDTDKRLGEALLASDKDRAEHTPAVASVVDLLRRVCADVTADPAPWLLKLANVQHLATRVGATVAGPESALDLAGILHPTAAVCGTPRATAMERIRAVEGMDRGRYSGPVGWVDAAGNGELGIALRCAAVAGNRARLFSGAGIVGQSRPEAELEETRLKLRAMQSALEGTAP